MGRLLAKFFFVDDPDVENEGSSSRYRRMWRNTVFAVAAVCIIPLLTITTINYYLYQQSFQKEITQPIQRITAITKRSLESFLEERISAAKYVVSRERPEDLFDSEKLAGIFKRMRQSFGGIVDIGVVDSEGIMQTYVGPYELHGKNYQDQDWFTKSLVRDVYVSDVFLGHRKVPHFIIAIKRDGEKGEPLIFRATVDIEGMVRQIQVAGLKRYSDAVLINRDGLLQTPSRLCGSDLVPFSGEVPPYSEGTQLFEDMKIKDRTYFMGSAYIEKSPFIFIILVEKKGLMAGWLAYQGEMLGILIASVLAIMLLIMRITNRWIMRIREADLRREATLHNVEHTNRMASIGRLAAGVAHEINNPLAIINEKAGLINDILDYSGDIPQKDKLSKQTDTIIKSVNRCSDITHRLLGFARHMDVKHEPVAIDSLIRDVLGFLEKEAMYRDIQVDMQVTEALHTIHSDKGQLQQLFLNLINNAFDAMKKGGRLLISIENRPLECVSITIKDDGVGIPKDDMEKIFEPFFTTKKNKGTGLGLSITYGIVKKLRGTISVESEIGKGTSFIVTLPVNRP